MNESVDRGRPLLPLLTKCVHVYRESQVQRIRAEELVDVGRVRNVIGEQKLCFLLVFLFPWQQTIFDYKDWGNGTFQKLKLNIPIAGYSVGYNTITWN